MLTHSQEKPYACTEPGCDQRYYTSQHLNRHLEAHSRPKPHSCTFPDCTASFSKRSQLQRHSCIHTGRKPYPCDYIDPVTSAQCTFEFDYPSQIKRHKETHDITLRESKFLCGEKGCGATFLTSSQLKSHMQSEHLPSRSFECKECGKAFKDASSLKRHEETHEYNEFISGRQRRPRRAARRRICAKRDGVRRRPVASPQQRRQTRA